MEHNNKLPKDWKSVKFSTIAKFIDYRGKTPKKTESGIPLITAKNVKMGYINENPREYIAESDYDKWMTRGIPKIGDVLFTTEAPMGNVAQLKTNNRIALAQRMITFQTHDGLINSFLKYNLMSPQFQKTLNSKGTGTTVKGIKASVLKQFEIPLPPLETQQAIVSKIEELFSELDKGIEDLKTSQQQLKIYRQSVLKWAFEGKLTNEKVKDGVLPKGWEWFRFGELFSESPQNGLYKPSTEYGTGTPIIRIDGFYDGVILNSYQFKRVRLNDDEVNRYLISVGDILVNRVNSMPYLGKCGIVKHLNEKTVFESNIMKIRVKKEISFSEYISIYLTSKKGLSELRKNAKQAVNQASINQTDVSNVLIPLPPIQEQHQIVQEIGSRFSVADKMEESITQSLQQAEALRQSILKKAFSGELV